MNGTITTWFQDKGFGFIKDEMGDNRYFHVIKVSNPELIKKGAEVTFEPGTNNKGLSAFSVKVIPASKYIFIAGERIKISAIKSYQVSSEEIPADGKVDKAHTILSVGLLMQNIRPKGEQASATMRTIKVLTLVTFQNEHHRFTADEIDIDETVAQLKKL